MKNISVILIFILFSTSTLGSNFIFEIKGNIIENQILNNKTTSFSSQIQKGRKTKDGRYKRKKGFMWGLFKSKKECDCPKH
jgi:hypothetical protein